MRLPPDKSGHGREGGGSGESAGALTLCRGLHAVKTVALHQRAGQGLVAGAVTQTTPAVLANQAVRWAWPLEGVHCDVCDKENTRKENIFSLS